MSLTLLYISVQDANTLELTESPSHVHSRREGEGRVVEKEGSPGAGGEQS